MSRPRRSKGANVAQDGESPLTFVLKIMRDESQPLPIRLDAARIALPYCHPKLHALTNPQGDGPQEIIVRHFVEQLPEETKPLKQAPQQPGMGVFQ